jgi:hypothetical protein
MSDILGPREDPAPVSPTVSPAVAALRSSLTDLVEESQALRGDVQRAEDARRKATVVNLGLLVLLVLFVGLLGAVSWQNNRVIEKVEETNSIMADCTTPGGACYEQSQKRVGSAINDIVWASVYMSQCARLWPDESGPSYDRKLEACVIGRLEQAAREREASPSPTPSVSPTPTGGR